MSGNASEKRGQALKSDRRPARETCRLSGYLIPRDWYRHDIVMTDEWATPTVRMDTYPKGAMTNTGSRWSAKDRTSGSWLLESQTLIEMANGAALGWNHLLHFVRGDLPPLIPAILDAQRAWLSSELDTERRDQGAPHHHDARLVLRAYAHNVRAAVDHYRQQLDDGLLWEHALTCGCWLRHDDRSPTGPCPQQVWLLNRLMTAGPLGFAKVQIRIWEAADPWSLLPLARQLPECGPDMAQLGAKAWSTLWWPIDAGGAAGAVVDSEWPAAMEPHCVARGVGVLRRPSCMD